MLRSVFSLFVFLLGLWAGPSRANEPPVLPVVPVELDQPGPPEEPTILPPVAQKSAPTDEEAPPADEPSPAPNETVGPPNLVGPPAPPAKEYILVVPTRHQDPEEQATIRLQLPDAPLPIDQLGETLGALREVMPEFNNPEEPPTLAIYTSSVPSWDRDERVRREQAVRGELSETFPEIAPVAKVEIRNVEDPEETRLTDKLDNPELARKVVKRFAWAKALTKGGLRTGAYAMAGTVTLDVTLLWKTVLVLGDSWVEYKSSMRATEIGNAFAKGLPIEFKNKILNGINKAYGRNKSRYAQFARGTLMNLAVFAIGRNIATQALDHFAQPTVTHLPGWYDVGVLAAKGAGGVVAYSLMHFGFEAARAKGALKLPRIELSKRFVGLVDPVNDFLNASPKLRSYSPYTQYTQWVVEAVIPLIVRMLPAQHRIVLIEKSVQEKPQVEKDVKDLEYLEIARVTSLDPESINEAIGRREEQAVPISAEQAAEASGYAIDRELTADEPCSQRLKRNSWRGKVRSIVVRFGKRPEQS